MSKVPAGWSVKTLGMICNGKLQTGPFGSQLYSYEYTEVGIPVLMPKDLINCRANLTSAAKIPPERAIGLKKHTLKEGDLLFSRRGDVARFALIEGNSAGALCGTGCLKASPSENYASEFLIYCLQLDSVKTWLEQNAVGQTMLNMNTSILSELPLFVSNNKLEQERIAQILSTWDKAIATTEQLIGNSQQQKKALMQSLLTGKNRLPGFEGEWKGFKLENVATISMGSSPKSSAYNDLNVGLPLLQGNADINNRHSSPRIYTSQITRECNVGDILLSVRAPVGSVAISLHHACIGRGIAAIKANLNTDQAFLYQWLLNYEPSWESLSQGSTFESVNSSDIKNLDIYLPPLQEQQKIAAVLTAADNEIELLQKKLILLKQEKAALMQQLLTGKRRVEINLTEECMDA